MAEWKGYENYNHYHLCWLTNGVYNWLKEIENSTPERIQIGKDFVWNIPASFDIETSSYKKMGKKYATMYVWSLCVNGSTIVGRTWAQFVSVIDELASALHTDKSALYIYVHNLGYEFQFMRKWFNWEEVFASKERKPIYARLTNGIEFRCSYLLSNYALEYLGNKLIKKYNVKKEVGSVDYSLIRHSKTELTEQDYSYNVKDVLVVTSFIQEKIENEGGIQNIPLTNTGYVRRYCRDYCFTQMQTEPKIVKKLKARYHERMKSLKIVSQCEYEQLHEAFSGGFTHAAPFHSGDVVEFVGSADEASAYPGVMVTKKFPMGRGTFIGEANPDDIDWLTNDGWCSLFTIVLKNVTPKFVWENYISVSKCQVLSDDAIVNNGRVASASKLQTTITEQDWYIIKECYYWDEIEIHNLRIYPADYLPRPFILSILKLFSDKTSLKDVEGKETEYMVSKNMINAAYGMSVTSIIRDLYEYSEVGDWLTTKANVTEQLTSYNESYNRFLFYGWGVWVTAHARHNLWKAIFEFGKDYVYADTDSIKGVNFKDHELFFLLYNMNVKCELKAMCNYWQIPFEKCQPQTIKGKVKTIGIWEMEEGYRRFKTIGAKRYIYEYDDGSLNFTISGVNKKFGVPYLLSTFSNPDYTGLYRLAYRPRFDEESESKLAMEKIKELHKSGVIKYEGVFEMFNEGLYFPPDATGKQTLTYIDEPIVDMCEDYNGVKNGVLELSSIYMEPQSYFMSQTVEYMRFLRGYKDASL